MFVLYCNSCFRRKEIHSNIQLYLNQCAHIICKECMKTTCVLCKRPSKPHLIDRNMSTSMAVFFEDPLKIYKRCQSVIKFQSFQKARYTSNFLKLMPDQYQKTVRQYQGFCKLEARLTTEIERERNRIEKMQTYVTYYKRVLQQRSVHRIQRNSTESKRNDSAYFTQTFTKKKRPQTPSVSSANTSSSGGDSRISSINSKKNIFTSTRKSDDFIL